MNELNYYSAKRMSNLIKNHDLLISDKLNILVRDIELWLKNNNKRELSDLITIRINVYKKQPTTI